MKKDKKDIIYYATIEHASKTGIADIVVSRLAKEAGVAQGTIFYYFKNMRELVDYCATRYDREIMEYCVELAKKGKTIVKIWDILFDFILKNPSGAVYYFDYVNYYGFNPTETNERAQEFLKIAHTLLKEKDKLSDHQLLILWDYITTQLFYYTTKIIQGYMKNTKENREFIKKTVFLVYDNI